jgi:hypothetical protein
VVPGFDRNNIAWVDRQHWRIASIDQADANSLVGSRKPMFGHASESRLTPEEAADREEGF